MLALELRLAGVQRTNTCHSTRHESLYDSTLRVTPRDATRKSQGQDGVALSLFL